MVVADSMPPNSDNVPFIAAYYFATMLTIGLVTTCTVITSNISRFGENEKPVPAFIQRIFFDNIAKFLLMNIKYDRHLKLSVKDFFSNKNFCKRRKSKFSPYINNVCQYEMDKKEFNFPSENEELLISNYKKQRKTRVNFKKTSLKNENASSLVDKRDLIKLVQLMKETTNRNNLKVSIEEYKEEIIGQWKQLARIIDTCFGLIFLIATLFLISFIAIFFYMNIHKFD